MMKLAVPTPNQATQAYLEKPSSFISNTFLNFQDDEDKPLMSKRSRSAGASRRWAAASPTDGLMQSDTALLSTADEEVHADALMESSSGTPLVAKKCELESAPGSSLMELMSKMLAERGNAGGSIAASVTTPEASSDGESEGEALPEVGVQAPHQNAGAPAEATQDILTTVHVMNLPRRFTCYDLRLELDASGYEGTYDFVHVPVTFTCGISTGYAFVNFRSPDVAARFMAEWQDSRRLCTRRWKHRKAMVVQAASIQGLCRFQTGTMTRRTQRIKNSNYKPWFAPSVLEAR